MSQFLNSVPLLISWQAALSELNYLKRSSLSSLYPLETDRSTENTANLLLRVFVSAETCLLNCSIAKAVCVISRIVTVPLFLRAVIT
jgi:hypothetical protein